MDATADSLKTKVLHQLHQERRWTLVENSVLCAGFALGGLIFTWILWWVVKIVVLVGAGGFGRYATGARMRLSDWQIEFVTLFILGVIVYLGRRTVRAPEFNPRDLGLFQQGGWRESEQTIQDVLSELAFIGPRCFVLAARCAVFLRRLYHADLSRLAATLEIALKRTGRITESDLPGIKMAEFLKEAQWIAGVLPLFRAPQGFILTEEFRDHFPGVRREGPRPRAKENARFREKTKEKGRPRYDINETVEDEIRWALLLLGLNEKATRKEINSAYRNLAKLVHPDLGPAQERVERENKMKDLNLAYEILRRRR